MWCAVFLVRPLAALAVPEVRANSPARSPGDPAGLVTETSAAELTPGAAVPEGDRRVRPVPGFDPRRTAGSVGGLALFAAVLGLYLASYSSVPTSDGGAWIAHIAAGDRENMLPAYHALPMYLLFRLRQLLADLGEPVGVLALIQAVNAALAATAAVLLYGAIRLLGGGPFSDGPRAASSPARSRRGTSPTASSTISRWWCSQLIFLLLVRARARNAPWSAGFPIALGALNALAIMLHQESVLFGFGAVAMLWAGRPWRDGLRDGLWYTLAGSAATLALAVAIAVSLRGLTSADETVALVFLADVCGAAAAYTLGGPALIALKVVKGELTALVAGTQVVADVARDRGLLGLATVRWLLAGTLAVYALMAVLLVDLVRRWRRLRAAPPRRRRGVRGVDPLLRRAAALVVLADRARIPHEHAAAPRSVRSCSDRSRPGAPAPAGGARRGDGALVLVGAVNVRAAIAPWYRYGLFRESLAAGQIIAFGPATSSSRPSPAWTRCSAGSRHLAVKDVLARLSKAAGFAAIDEAIAERLARGQRVFVYNFVPGDFTLLGLEPRGRASRRPAAHRADFEAFMAALGPAPRARAGRRLLGGGKAPLYLFGERAETMWEIRPRMRRRPGASARRSGPRRDAPDPGPPPPRHHQPRRRTQARLRPGEPSPRDGSRSWWRRRGTASPSSDSRTAGGRAAAEPSRGPAPAADGSPHPATLGRRRPHSRGRRRGGSCRPTTSP